MDRIPVFPAPAGINRGCGFSRNQRISVPRASGDKPHLMFNELTNK